MAEPDERLVQYVTQRDRFSASQRVLLRYDQDEAVGPKWERLESSHLNRIGRNTDVGEPCCDRGDDILAWLLFEIHIDRGMSGEKRSERSGQMRQSRRVRQQTYMATKPLRVLPQITAHLFQVAQHDARVVCEGLSAGVGRTPRGFRSSRTTPADVSIPRMRALAEASARPARSAPCVMFPASTM